MKIKKIKVAILNRMDKVEHGRFVLVFNMKIHLKEKCLLP